MLVSVHPLRGLSTAFAKSCITSEMPLMHLSPHLLPHLWSFALAIPMVKIDKDSFETSKNLCSSFVSS